MGGEEVNRIIARIDRMEEKVDRKFDKTLIRGESHEQRIISLERGRSFREKLLAAGFIAAIGGLIAAGWHKITG